MGPDQIYFVLTNEDIDRLDPLERQAIENIVMKIAKNRLPTTVGGKSGQSGHTHQYFYKSSNCLAETPHDTNCICWHDEGAGPFPAERRADQNTLMKWRVKSVAP